MREPSSTSTNADAHAADLTRGMEHLRPYVSVTTRSPLNPQTERVAHAEQTEAHTTYGVPSTLINPPRKSPQRARSPSNPNKRSDPFQFGSRYLEEGDDIFEFNAWDHVEVDDAFKEFAEQQYQRQRESPVSDFDKSRFNSTPHKWWDRFYSNNASNFFKDRKWLFQEFPVLKEATSATSSPVTILEVGAGAGNTAFPILAANTNPGLKLHACDFSSKAVQLMRDNPAFDAAHMAADEWDVAACGCTDGSVSLPPNLGPESVDIVILIFVFSALAPAQWLQALRNINEVLKPGGEILFRDYGRGDLAQVRFKKGRWLEDNFYVRGDGTRVYFFDKEELEELFSGAPLLNASEAKANDTDQRITHDREKEGPAAPKDIDGTARPHFEILNVGIDRRMLVNRQRRLKMYRCWMQGRFRKPRH